MTAGTTHGAPIGAPLSAGGTLRSQPSGSPTALTGRGGIVVVFAVTLTGAVLGGALNVGVLAGIAFVAGCLLAALTTRRADLLTLVVSPPIVFFAVTVLRESMHALHGSSFVQSLLVGLIVTLAGDAPWLFAGTLLVVAIAVPRGLMASVRDLRSRLAGAAPPEEDDDPVRWDEDPREDPRNRTRRPEPR